MRSLGDGWLLLSKEEDDEELLEELKDESLSPSSSFLCFAMRASSSFCRWSASDRSLDSELLDDGGGLVSLRRSPSVTPRSFATLSKISRRFKAGFLTCYVKLGL